MLPCAVCEPGQDDGAVVPLRHGALLVVEDVLYQAVRGLLDV